MSPSNLIRLLLYVEFIRFVVSFGEFGERFISALPLQSEVKVTSMAYNDTYRNIPRTKLVSFSQLCVLTRFFV